MSRLICRLRGLLKSRWGWHFWCAVGIAIMLWIAPGFLSGAINPWRVAALWLALTLGLYAYFPLMRLWHVVAVSAVILPSTWISTHQAGPAWFVMLALPGILLACVQGYAKNHWCEPAEAAARHKRKGA
jgi:hypothetical protein